MRFSFRHRVSDRAEIIRVRMCFSFADFLSMRSPNSASCKSPSPSWASKNLLRTGIQTGDMIPVLQSDITSPLRLPILIAFQPSMLATTDLFRHIYPEYLDMTQAKIWIARCKELHTMCHMSGGPPRLNGLRVIDCAQLQVVEAPPGCQYVALSYVWGKQNTEAMHQGFENSGQHAENNP